MWTKVDDHLHAHEKVKRVWRENRDALALHLRALSRAGELEQDGRVDAVSVEEWLPKPSERRRLVGVLLAAGLWEELADGDWRIHDYLEDNLSSDQNRTRRLAERQRKALTRSPSLIAAVRERDGEHCRYCGGQVSFDRRRTNDGATYDIVMPDDPISLENVVLSCRRCNTRKASLTPEQAGISVLPEPAAQLALEAPVRTDNTWDVLRRPNGRPSKPDLRDGERSPVAPTRPDPTRPEGVVRR